MATKDGQLPGATHPAVKDTSASPRSAPQRLPGGRKMESQPRQFLAETPRLADPPRGRGFAHERVKVDKPKPNKRGRSLPRLAFRKGTESSASSASIPTPVLASQPMPTSPISPKVKPSMDTNHSGMSSSVYPLSSPTVPDSPHSFLDMEETRLSLDNDEAHTFDADDISYRLRLLVNNNYFLPPAHAKPSPADLASPSRNPKPSRPSTPRFFDYFRSKPKANVTSPEEAPVIDIRGPIIRNTGDSSTLGGLVQRPQEPKTARPAGPKVFVQRPSLDRVPKVVVVRERLDDLFDAAKQAERELNARTDPRTREVLRVDAQFVDPTDIVDVARPRDGDGSDLRGLGFRDSVGAAIMADQLPPPGTPIWSTDTDREDATWRKKLLHEAVSLSLSSAESSFRETPVSLPASPTPATGSDPEKARAASVLKPGPFIGERILDPALLDSSRSPSPFSLKRRPRTAPTKTPPRPSGLPRLQPALPRPDANAPTTPLAPPPRKSVYANPPHSLSQTDLPSASADLGDLTAPAASSTPHPGMRRSISSPMFASQSSSYDTGGPSLSAAKGKLRMTPSPSRIPRPRTVSPSPSLVVSAPDGVTAPAPRERVAGTARDSLMSQFGYSPDTAGRNSLSPHMAGGPSLASSGRPSFDHSPSGGASPTASVFQEAFEDGYRRSAERVPSPFAQRSFGMTMASRASRFSYQSTSGSLPPSGRASVAAMASVPGHPRASMASPPPPRASSSFAHIALSPPPRKRPTTAATEPSRLTFGPSKPSLLSSASQLSLSADSSSYYTVSGASSIPHIMAPEPTTPPFPLDPTETADTPESHERPPRLSEATVRRPQLADLLIPGNSLGRSGSIHSAPEVLSPTAFFDAIQENPGILTDLDAPDESDSDDEAAAPVPSPSVYGSASASAVASPQPGSARPSTSTGSSHPSLGPPPSPRPSFMRLGNHSSPSLAGRRSSSRGPAQESVDRRRGIANVPAPRPFFSARAKREGAGAASRQVYQYASAGAVSAASLFPEDEGEELPAPGRPHSPTSSMGHGSRGGDAASVHSVSSSKEEAESRRLDGVFAQHMQAERDQIKRITTTFAVPRRPFGY